MPMIFDIPENNPFDDMSEYIPLLISSVEEYFLLPSAWPEGEYEEAYDRVQDLLLWLLLYPEGAMTAPNYATLWHDEAQALTGNDITAERDTDETQKYAVFAYQFDAADGDEFAQNLFLEAGLYEFDCLGIKDSDGGLLDWYIDGDIVLSGQDWFAGLRDYNVQTANTFNVIGTGKHILTAVVNGKNAESTGYFIRLTKYWFRKLE